MGVSILPVRNRARALRVLPDKRSKNRFKMRDLRRLLKYLLPHTGTFIAANFAMIVVGLMDGATTLLLIPIMNQVFKGAQTSSTFFIWQKIIPPSGLAAWRVIALLLIAFTVIKGIAEYLSTYWMAYI